MAPSLHMSTDAEKVQQNGLKKTKIRKPLIEKMRRDRINSCIEQLRTLLEKNIQQHHPHSKLEKADILEMAVSYLQQQRQQQMNSVDCLQNNGKDSYYQGYYMCLKEMVGFLHNQEPSQSSQAVMLNNFCRQQVSSGHFLAYQTVSQQKSPCQVSQHSKDIWRPW
ncbi:transcription factor HES-5-like [Discoglossus pictus]